jgi:DNA-binding response OmpR family regulator
VSVPASASEPHDSPGRILIVDDEDAIRVLCRINLRLAGFDTLEAADGDVAVATARAERPDAIVLDVMMPGRDGWEVAEALAADPTTAEIPVIFLSARTDESDRRRGLELGALDYVRKPFDPLELVSSIRDVLERVGRGEAEALRRERLAELSHDQS